MSNKPTNRERLQEITAGIEQGIRELFESEKYMRYLSVMSRFHRYSVNNTVLIYMQRPDATLVAGFHKWKDQFERHVKKGEHGITIIAPTPYKKKVEEMKRDPDTHAPILDADGKAIMEEKEIEIPLFRPVRVFDVSQTDGKPLPELASSLSGTVPHYEAFLEALRRSAPVPIELEPMADDMDGYFSSAQQRIAIREGMSEVQTVSAAVHEIAHSKLHDTRPVQLAHDEEYQEVELFGKPALFCNERVSRDDLPEGVYCYDLRGSDYDPGDPICVEERVVVNHAGSVLMTEPLELGEGGRRMLREDEGLNFTGGFATLAQFLQVEKKDRHTEEVEAESVSYAVCQYFGIQTGENSFGYIASWSQSKELKELRASLETINKTACELIGDIERHYKAICKERGIDLTATTEQTAPRQAVVPELDEYPMPDDSISAEGMLAYGYTHEGMLPLQQERARELEAAGLTVYVLHEDDTESMVFDPQEIMDHGGLFGVDREEWEKSAQFHEKVMERQEHQQEREQAFLAHEGSCFAIYQVKHTDALRDIRYEGLEWLRSHDLAVDRNNYDLIYTAPLSKSGTVPEQLEKLYQQFNLERPADYHSPSMSVSDIVAIKQDGKVSCHYCDRAGFTEIHGFLSDDPLKNAELAMEDDCGMIDGIINNGAKDPTVAEPEQQDRSGQTIPQMDLAAAAHREEQDKKKSVVAQLKSRPKAEHKKTAPPKSAEREI